MKKTIGKKFFFVEKTILLAKFCLGVEFLKYIKKNFFSWKTKFSYLVKKMLVPLKTNPV